MATAPTSSSADPTSPPRRLRPAWLSVNHPAVRAVILLTLALGALALLGMGGLWVASRPMFSFKTLRIEGDLTRNNQSDLRQMALPRLQGNFFTLPLGQTREVFESVPWVRRAVVRRIWPDQLVVRLEEHQPLAIWREQGLPDRLLSRLGEVFEANLGEVDNLPEFEGGRGQAPQVMAMYHQLQTHLAPLAAVPVRVALSPRGSWEVELRHGELLVLGRGSEEDVLERLDRFVQSIGRVNFSQPGRTWDRADLRHANGYALHLGSVPTAGAAAPTQ